MIAQDSVLVQLAPLVERLPTPPPPPRRRGRPTVYSDGLFLKAPTIMIVRCIHRVGELLAVLEEPTEEMRALRELLWEAIQSVYERTALDTVDAVAQSLDDLLTEMEAKERDRRAKAILGLAYFRPALPIEKIPTQAAKFAFSFQGSFSRATVTVASQEAAAKVSELREQQRRREEFHGKEVLTGFYRRHLHHTGMPKNIFTFEAARYASRRKAVSEYFDAFFTMLSNPSDIGR
jgi:hypothetical protein